MREPKQLERATPDAVIDQGPLHAVVYDVDLTSLTPATAPLMLSHVFGRIGAAFSRHPDRAHYLNLYQGSGLSEDIRAILFPAILDAAHSTSVQDHPARAFARVHGVVRPLVEAEAEAFLATGPASLEMFAIGPQDRPVEMFGLSIDRDDLDALEAHARQRGRDVVWLTRPRP